MGSVFHLDLSHRESAITKLSTTASWASLWDVIPKLLHCLWEKVTQDILLQGGNPYPSHYLPVSCVTFRLLLNSPVHFANLHKSYWDLRGMEKKLFVPLWQLQRLHLLMGRPSRICSFLWCFCERGTCGRLYQGPAEQLSTVFHFAQIKKTA